jgi:rod shape-determining protein MreC
VNDPDRDGFIEVVIKPDAHLNSLDEVLVITSTEPRFSDNQMKDLAMSQDLKGAEAAALADQKKASEIMAERLPGLTDPNAPPPAPAANGTPPAPAGPTLPGSTAVVPKLLPPSHPDRFTPGNAVGSTTPPAPKPKEPPSTAPKAGTTTAPARKPAEPNASSSGTPKPPVAKPSTPNATAPAAKTPLATHPATQPPAPQPQERQ